MKHACWLSSDKLACEEEEQCQCLADGFVHLRLEGILCGMCGLSDERLLAVACRYSAFRYSIVEMPERNDIKFKRSSEFCVVLLFRIYRASFQNCRSTIYIAYLRDCKMQYALFLFPIVASLANAQNEFTMTTLSTITAGKPYTITWAPSPGTSAVNLVLRQGDSSALSTVETIACTFSARHCNPNIFPFSRLAPISNIQLITQSKHPKLWLLHLDTTTLPSPPPPTTPSKSSTLRILT